MTKKKTNEQEPVSNPCTAEEEITEAIEENDTANGEKVEKSECELLQEQLSEEKNNFLRLLADFDNFRKRMTEQSFRMKLDGIAYAIEVIFPVLDSID
ncbi:MAG: nucleotide exchange factor GrpE, partial [Clostridia bacterium]|nr:nucleotide exchange factor GrpE [Clostridia bacterium]